MNIIAVANAMRNIFPMREKENNVGGYDLYGNWYPRTQDALNAEEAQCARIDARIAIEHQQKINYEMDMLMSYLKDENELLKKRIKELEQSKK